MHNSNAFHRRTFLVLQLLYQFVQDPGFSKVQYTARFLGVLLQRILCILLRKFDETGRAVLTIPSSNISSLGILCMWWFQFQSTRYRFQRNRSQLLPQLLPLRSWSQCVLCGALFFSRSPETTQGPFWSIEGSALVPILVLSLDFRVVHFGSISFRLLETKVSKRLQRGFHVK